MGDREPNTTIPGLSSEITTKIAHLLEKAECSPDNSALAGYDVASETLNNWSTRPRLGVIWRDNTITGPARLIISSTSETEGQSKYSIQVHAKPKGTDGNITWVYTVDPQSAQPILRAYQYLAVASQDSTTYIQNGFIKRPATEEDLGTFVELLNSVPTQ